MCYEMSDTCKSVISMWRIKHARQEHFIRRMSKYKPKQNKSRETWESVHTYNNSGWAGLLTCANLWPLMLGTCNSGRINMY